jgi:hypothetical protein
VRRPSGDAHAQLGQRRHDDAMLQMEGAELKWCEQVIHCVSSHVRSPGEAGRQSGLAFEWPAHRHPVCHGAAELVGERRARIV